MIINNGDLISCQLDTANAVPYIVYGRVNYDRNALCAFKAAIDGVSTTGGYGELDTTPEAVAVAENGSGAVFSCLRLLVLFLQVHDGSPSTAINRLQSLFYQMAITRQAGAVK